MRRWLFHCRFCDAGYRRQEDLIRHVLGCAQRAALRHERRTEDRELIRGNVEAETLLDAALQGQQGARTDLVNNVNEVGRPEGNSRQRAIRKLRAKRPDLLEHVERGAPAIAAAEVA